MGKYDLKYLSQEYDSKVLYLVKQKGFYPYECMSGFEKFQEELPTKKSFIGCWWVKHLLIKSMNMFLKFKMKAIKDYLKMWCFVSWCLWKKSELRV